MSGTHSVHINAPTVAAVNLNVAPTTSPHAPVPSRTSGKSSAGSTGAPKSSEGGRMLIGSLELALTFVGAVWVA